MADHDDDVKPDFTYTWTVRNFRYCLQEAFKILRSPAFIMDTAGKSRWNLWLCNQRFGVDNHIGCHLRRKSFDEGPMQIGVEFNFYVLHRGDTLLPLGDKYIQFFEKGASFGNPHCFLADELFHTKRDTLLSQDDLTLCCRIWIRNSQLPETCQYIARTHIGVEKYSFTWPVENFSSFESGQQRITNIRSAKLEESLLSITMLLERGCPIEQKLQFQILPRIESITFASLSIYLLEATGTEAKCEQSEFIFGKKIRAWNFLTRITKESIMSHKTLYLSNDTLHLHCELTISKGLESERIEKTEYQLKSIVHKPSCARSRALKRKLPALQDDLQHALKRKILSDVTLRAGQEVFPVHRAILGARSPVFRAMFEREMKEKQTGEVDITDLDADTVQKVVTFIYADTVGDLQSESALKLYFAADKYEVVALKEKCSNFFVENLTVSNACDILVLADRHQDGDLKATVQDFVLKHDEEVFCSKRWKGLMHDDPMLASQTMHLKYIKE